MDTTEETIRRWTAADVPDRFKSKRADRLRELLSLSEVEIREMPAGQRLDDLVWRHSIEPFVCEEQTLAKGPFSTDASLALDAVNFVNKQVDACGQLSWTDVGWLAGDYVNFDLDRTTEVVVPGYDGASMALAISRYLLLDFYLTESHPNVDPVETLEEESENDDSRSDS